MRQATIATLVLLLIPLISGCGGCASKHDSPEAAFEAMRDAAKEKDWETATEQMTEEAQDVLAGGMVFMLGFAGAFDAEHRDEIEALLRKHGLDTDKKDDDASIDLSDQEAALAKLVEPIDDKPAFIADAMAMLEKLDEGDDNASYNLAMDGELEDLKIDGDSATAVIVTKKDGKENRAPIAFRKVDGGWLVHFVGKSAMRNDSEPNAPVFSSNDGERMGGFDEELPEPAGIPEEKLAPADLRATNLTATLAVSSDQPDDLFGSFAPGSQFASATLKGQPILDAYQYGHVHVEATDDAGQKLALAQPLKDKFGGELGSAFVELDHFFLDIQDELQVDMAFAPASAETKQISEASGTVKLKVRTSVLIDDIQNKVGQTLSDPALKPFGEFQVVASREQDGDPATTIALICKGKGHRAHKLALVGRDGEVIAEHAWRYHGDDYTRYVLESNEAVPAGTQLKITLSGSERILVVPLELAK